MKKLTCSVRNYNGEEYSALAQPEADNEHICTEGERVILYHVRTGPGHISRAELRIAPINVICAGWVVGLIRISPAAKIDEATATQAAA